MTVENAAVGTGMGCSVVLYGGVPWVAYRGASDTLKVSKASSATPSSYSNFTAHTVDSTTGLGAWTDMVVTNVNGSDRLAIAYNDHDTGDLKIALATAATPTSSGNWRRITVESNLNTGIANSLVAFPHSGGSVFLVVSHFESTDRNLRFTYATTDDPTVAGDFVNYNIAVDWSPGTFTGMNYFWDSTISKNRIGIAAYDLVKADLWYASADIELPAVSDWTTYVIDSGAEMGAFCSLANLGGKPAISYADMNNQDLKCAISSSAHPTSAGSWAIHTVDAGGDVGAWTDTTVIDSRLYIVYMGGSVGSGDLRTARAEVATPTTSTDWQLSTAVSGGNAGYTADSSASAFDNTGRLWMTYWDPANDRVGFTRANSYWTYP